MLCYVNQNVLNEKAISLWCPLKTHGEPKYDLTLKMLYNKDSAKLETRKRVEKKNIIGWMDYP